MAEWVHMGQVQRGLLVICRLCGTKQTRKVFDARASDYAEARRLATAYHWEHEHSEMHRAALAAFHADAVEPPREETLLRQAFGEEPMTDQEIRIGAARDAARRVVRQEKLMRKGMKGKRRGPRAIGGWRDE